MDERDSCSLNPLTAELNSLWKSSLEHDHSSIIIDQTPFHPNFSLLFYLFILCLLTKIIFYFLCLF
jgi:hypothetical protein